MEAIARPTKFQAQSTFIDCCIKMHFGISLFNLAHHHITTLTNNIITNACCVGSFFLMELMKLMRGLELQHAMSVFKTSGHI